MTEKEFVVDLESGVVRYRTRFRIEKGQVLEFVVQLEYRVGGEWRPVVRYDTAHGQAHCDAYAPDGTVTPHQPLGFADYNQALTYAQDAVKRNWRQVTRPFEELRT
jgi:hypothetical protein